MLSPAEIQEVERVREEIAMWAYELYSFALGLKPNWRYTRVKVKNRYRELADQILRTIGYIPSKDQSLPRNPFFHTTHMNTTYPCKACVVEEYQQDMKDRLRCINIEEYKEG